MAARRAAAEIARALRDHHERHAEQRGAQHQPVIGVVKSVGGGTPGFSVAIPDSGFVLDSDDLIVGQSVAQYDQDYGIDVGDSVSLMPLANGDYVAVAVHTGTEATKRKTGGGANATSGPPGPSDGQDGDFAIDPATGDLYGPKTAGVWPAAIPLTGPAGPTGPSGPNGGVRYVYSSDTAATDPTAGKVKFDSVTLASITACRISETDGDGNGLAGWLASFDDSTTTAHRGTLLITKDGAPTSFLILDVTGALTDNGTWDSFAVAVLASNGSFTNGDSLRVFFSRTGDLGATGTTGGTGPTGPTGPSGAGIAIGSMFDWPGPARSIPALYLACFGQSVLRSTYASLFAVLCPVIAGFTVTLASPGVLTTGAAHGLVVGDAVFMTTTGALPTGMTANLTYYVMTVPSSTSLTLGTTRTVSAITGVASVTTAVNTSVSQSGLHSLFHAPYGVVDATHFNLPDFRGRAGVGQDDMGGSAASVLSWTKVPGLVAGEQAHLLLSGEAAQKSVSTGAGTAHAHKLHFSTAPGGAAGTYIPPNNAASALDQDSDAESVHVHAVAGSDAVATHNLMAPGVVVQKIIYAGV